MFDFKYKEVWQICVLVVGMVVGDCFDFGKVCYVCICV